MSLFVYITENCRADAQRHALSTDLDRFVQRVSQAQSLSLFDPFPQDYHVKKKFGGRQARLIAKQLDVELHNVIVLLAIVIRGDRSYDEFYENPKQYGEAHFSSLIDFRVLREFVDEQTREPEKAPLPYPSDAENEILYSSFPAQGPGADEIIYESQIWVNTVTAGPASIINNLNLFNVMCDQAITDASPGLQRIDSRLGANIHMWVYRDGGNLVLLVPATSDNAQSARDEAERLASLISPGDLESICRISRRAYPAIVVYDQDTWIELERDAHANMALSPEESRVRNSAREAGGAFPLFINGRAGSGKSTILHYLTAELLRKYLQLSPGHGMLPPLYLTANAELLRGAREFVSRLLSKDRTLNTTDHPLPPNRIGEISSQSFREFRAFLLSLLPTPQREGRFSAVNYVGYARFKQLWREKFKNDRRAHEAYGPDLSWHVIRSFIKGITPEVFLEPEDYAHVPKRYQSVTKQTFDAVYEIVWAWYQEKCDEEGLWDDQDLARHVLSNDLVMSDRPAVFCDEAQDFTRLELEVLLNLNLFSKRLIPTQDLKRVVNVFAGDPFQTLNPTGFRWESIKNAFHEKFRVPLNPQELRFNYRSARSIVKFGNRVQMLRGAVFPDSGVGPQEHWSKDTPSFPVTSFSHDDAEFWKAFQSLPGLAVIVPCNEGEELTFVRDDLQLRAHIDHASELPANVYSAARAKGLEFNTVVVYGFGATLDTDVAKLLDSDIAANPDEALPVEYFVNRLYVAVSRPKQRLIIVDTAEGLQRLWACATEHLLEERLLQQAPGGASVWRDTIEPLLAGDARQLLDTAAPDTLEQAEMLEMRGWAARDSYNLKQAARSFKSAERFDKAYECEAKANEVDGLFASAADLYSRANLQARWALCLWKAGGGSWPELASDGQARPRLSGTPEVRLAVALTRRVEAGQLGPLIASLGLAMKADALYRAEVLAEPQYWQKPVQDLLRELLDDPSVSLPAFAAAEEAVAEIYELGLPIDAALRAQIAHAARRYPQVITLCEEYQLTNLRCYENSKAHIAPFPLSISLLASTGDSKAICALYDERDTAALEKSDAAHVVDALIAKGRLAEALNACWRHGLATQALSLARNAVGKDNAVARRACLAWAFLAAASDVDSLARSADALRDPSPRFPVTEDQADSALQALMNAELIRLRHLIARGTARNGKMHELSEAARSSIGKLLLDTFGGYENTLDIHDSSGTPVIEVITALDRAKCFAEAKRAYEAALAQAQTPEAKRPWAERALRFYERCIPEADRHGLAEESEDMAGRVKLALRILGIESSVDIPEFAALAAPALFELETTRCTSQPEGSDDKGLVRDTASNSSDRESEEALASPSVSATGPSKRLEHIEFTLHGLNFRVRRNLSRINVEHEQSGRQGFIRLDQRLCGGDEFRWTELSHDRRFVSDRCGITVEYGGGQDSPVLIEIHGTGITLTIESAGGFSGVKV
jgi:superfamily I DNA/RNA helicase